MSEIQLNLLDWTPPIPNAFFDGETYEPNHDHARLRGQLLQVFDLMQDNCWRTLEEISQKLYGATGRDAGISARLRDLRKEKFGGHTVDRRSKGKRHMGVFEYRLTVRNQ